MRESPATFVPSSVLLELEWVMRGFYGVEAAAFCAIAEHLLGMPHVTVERWEAASDAIELHRKGFDFADALHWASSRHCERFVTFDDRGVVRKGRRIAIRPPVVLPV